MYTKLHDSADDNVILEKIMLFVNDQCCKLPMHTSLCCPDHQISVPGIENFTAEF